MAQTFAEIAGLAADCRFRDCTHGPEPGCAVQAAVKAGQIDAGRVERWKKLRLEDAEHTASALDRKRKGKSLSRLVKQAKRIKRGG